MKENLSTCSVVYNIWSDGRYCANPSVPLVLGMIVTYVGSRLSHGCMPTRSRASFSAHMKTKCTWLGYEGRQSHAFIMGSVCSSSQPVRAWPAS